MTEETARTKWCPMVRFSGEDNNSTFNRADIFPMNHPETNNVCIPRCIASDCMMWRMEGSSNKLGYCGLAGKL